MQPFDVPFDNTKPDLDYLRGELDAHHLELRKQALASLFALDEKDVAWHDFLTAERLVLEKQYLYDYPQGDYEKGGILYQNAQMRADADYLAFKISKRTQPATHAEPPPPAQPEPPATDGDDEWAEFK